MSDNIPTQQDPAPFTITVLFTAEQIAEVLSDGLEQGTHGSQWVKIVKMTPPSADGPQLFPSFGHYPVSGGSLTIENTETGKLHTLDRAAIEQGIALLPKKAPRTFAAMANGVCDPIRADEFVQCCVLGDVIYG